MANDYDLITCGNIDWAKRQADPNLIDTSRLWHEATEKPKPHKILLCEVRNGFQVVSWTHKRHTWFWWVKNAGIVKWLYICELLPKQKSIVKQNNR